MVSDQVRHKPGCTATQDSQRLEILDLERRIVLFHRENIGADQLPGYSEAGLHLCFCIYAKWLSHDAAQIKQIEKSEIMASA